MTDEGEDIHREIFKARLNPESSLAAKAAGEKTVRMVFPRNVGLTLADHSAIKFERKREEDGDFVRDVPLSLADHPFLGLAGVKPEE